MKLKKLCAFVLAGMMAVSLAACTDGNGNEPSKDAQSQVERVPRLRAVHKIRMQREVR